MGGPEGRPEGRTGLARSRGPAARSADSGLGELGRSRAGGLRAGRGGAEGRPGRTGAGERRRPSFRCWGGSTSPGACGFREARPPPASRAPALGSREAMAGPGPGDPDEQYDFLFKLVLVGDASVGKTCVVQRFKTGAFSERQSSTIGVDFTMKTLEIQGKRVKVGGPAWGPRAGGPLRPPRSPGSDAHRAGPCPWRVPLGGGGGRSVPAAPGVRDSSEVPGKPLSLFLSAPPVGAGLGLGVQARYGPHSACLGAGGCESGGVWGSWGGDCPRELTPSTLLRSDWEAAERLGAGG